MRQFLAFHAKHPEIWRLFRGTSDRLAKAGFTQYSARGVCHYIRAHIALETNDRRLKINNNFTPLYARLYHLARPDLGGFFRNRERISLKKGERTGPELPAEWPAEEKDLDTEDSLRKLLENDQQTGET